MPGKKTTAVQHPERKFLLKDSALMYYHIYIYVWFIYIHTYTYVHVHRPHILCSWSTLAYIVCDYSMYVYTYTVNIIYIQILWIWILYIGYSLSRGPVTFSLGSIPMGCQSDFYGIFHHKGERIWNHLDKIYQHMKLDESTYLVKTRW